jgi:Tfp pilus assembly protein PilX
MVFGLVNNKRVAERGATALMIVVFSVLLLMTISVSFMRLVVQDQERTNNDELSRGAYDSSLAGVEDGKRVLQACIGNNDAAACSAIAADECNTIHSAKVLSASDSSSNTDEVMVQNSSGTDGGYDQAYSCVKIDRNTSDYQGSLSNDSSEVVPLQTVGSFTQVTVSWFKNPGAGTAFDLNASPSPLLPTATKWAAVGKTRPPLLRVQLMQYNGQNFKLDDFDQSGGSNTLYLYPSSVGLSVADFSSDARRSKTNNLLIPVKCNPGVGSQYICSATLTLPLPVGLPAAQIADRKAYLRVTSLYGDTDFTIQPVGTELQDVEPAIDSTGRAADVYRRVRARVQLVSPAETELYPRATVDITHNFCKDFGVSDSQYIAGSCDYTKP